MGKIFFSKKKSRSAEKNERGESFVSPGMVCYAEKQEKPFWFSSLDQIVHFDAIIFCRTLVELFWSVRVDRKKVTITVAFHFMKRRLKNWFFEKSFTYHLDNFQSIQIGGSNDSKDSEPRWFLLKRSPLVVFPVRAHFEYSNTGALIQAMVESV